MASKLKENDNVRKINNIYQQASSKMKEDKYNINQVNFQQQAKRDEKPRYDYFQNLKEYSESINDVYFKGAFSKIKKQIDLEKVDYQNKVDKIFPKWKIQKYNDQFFDKLNQLKNLNPLVKKQENQQNYNQNQNQNQKNNYYNQSQNNRSTWFKQYWSDARQATTKLFGYLDFQKWLLKQKLNKKVGTILGYPKAIVNKLAFFILSAIFLFGLAIQIPGAFAQYMLNRNRDIQYQQNQMINK
ncbi:hypothetical protein pb186bvf_013500 [Paramecium bursaria]